MYIQALFNAFCFICFFLLPAQAEELLSAKNLKDFQIISAEKLNYQEGDSILIGDVKIKLGAYTISAPKVFVDSDDNGSPHYARFIDGAVLDSDSLKIDAERMEFDISKSLFKCFASVDGEVETTIKDYNDPIYIYSKYQEYMLDTGFARVSAQEKNSNNAFHQERVRVLSSDFKVESNFIELESGGKSVKYIDFIGKVLALGSKQRIEANELLYFPDTEIIKAEGSVKTLYLQENQPAYLFSDLLVYETIEKQLSAYSKNIKHRAEFHSNKSYGQSRQILLKIDQDDALDHAILTGDAFAQYHDKSLTGYEILFDLKNMLIRTLVGRPRTQILK